MGLPKVSQTIYSLVEVTEAEMNASVLERRNIGSC